jgi:2-dehydro-3-deoxyphosphogluconate aldolase/(4S)-4-hydroxy-2-oxoglutarate aldolase
MTHNTATSGLEQLWVDRVVAVIRAEEIPDPLALCQALLDGGIRTVEFTFTTPDVDAHLRATTGYFKDSMSIGVGTVLSAGQAALAIDAGARFLVTPCVRLDVADTAARRGTALLMGAFTPGEVYTAHAAGAAAVKVFPAGALGAAYLKALHGPFPDIALVPSGGISAANAADYLDNGAAAVTAGTSVVSPDLIAEGAWDEITARAAEFVTSVRSGQ